MVANLLKITYKITKRFFVIIEKKEKEGTLALSYHLNRINAENR